MLQLLVVALLFTENLEPGSCSPRPDQKPDQDDWIRRAIHYMESNPETLQELMSKDFDLMEGDIVLSRDRNAVGSRWPTLRIPYVISSDLDGQTGDILAAMEMLSRHTCITFHKRTTETDYLFFRPSRGCASFVGYRGGQQPVFIGPHCIVGNIVHEVLHALGFHHEHTRTDRGQYITILSPNIMPGKERNFQMYDGETFNLPYDTASIMHYGSTFFSSNGLPTIVANKDVNGMGQRVKMTETDVKRVRELYSCDSLKHETETRKTDDNGNSSMADAVTSDLGTNRTNQSSSSSITVVPPVSLLQLTSTSRRCSNSTRPL
ncbi:astacin-like metalloendopeptidase isoform X1 [Amphiprion ocellaris]|uniref:Metalloendopeptidase n=1 Tax=Amphiprion ocellaris TaxID=80972 RepID=A0A3Q1CAK2_AMPOC|nr:astacin-like metalloendopeptidase isoform X1 [Amphiprion ocellaris]